MMRTSYDPEADAMAPGVMLDFDDKGEVIGVEILYVSQRMAKTKPAA
jgi:uncharacterized protein YuzE